MSTAGESEMCYSLGTSVGDVTRLNVANVLRSYSSCKRKSMTIYNQRGAIQGIDNNIFTEVGIEYQRQCEKVL